MDSLKFKSQTCIPLRPIINYTDYLCYALARFLHNNRSSDVVLSFDIVNLFTNIPVDEASEIMKKE
jgi:hypothetical protein